MRVIGVAMGPGFPRSRGKCPKDKGGSPYAILEPITHTHTMIPLITDNTDELAEICRRHHVKRLEVFGSAAVGDFDPNTSDIDFLVEFDDSDEFLLFQTRRDLTQELESLFNRSVDIVIFANVENPYFRTSVENTREPIFEA